jgi:ABC-2 type transport system permease protein
MLPIEEELIAPPDRPKTLTYHVAHSVSGICVTMLMFGLLACSTTLLDERAKGVLQRLVVAAMPRESILLGKFMFCAMIGIVQMAVLFAFGNTLFKIDAFRDPVTLLILSVTWTAVATSFGMLIASSAHSTKQAEGLATILILVLAALGGCWVPIQMVDLPLAGEILVRATPTYWSVTGYQGMFWDHLSWTHPRMLSALAVQWGIAAAAAIATVFIFRRRYLAG